MPHDVSGKFHMNPQIAAKASKVTQPKAPEAPKPLEAKPTDEDTDENVTSLHDHGDGSFHTESKTDRADHDSLEEALAHIAALHGKGGEPEQGDKPVVEAGAGHANYKHLSGI